MPKLLIVDDHPLFRDGLAQTVAQMTPTPTILLANSVATAKRLIVTNEDIDLVIVDLVMPGESGLDLLAYLADSPLVVPAIAISGETNIHLINSAIQLGSLGFIAKTAAPAVIAEAIEAVLSGDCWIPETVRIQLDGATSGSLPTLARDLGITPRQYSVLELMADGLANRDIAGSLNLTEHTVKSHSQALFSALGVHNRTACVARAQALELIPSASQRAC